MIFFKCRLPYKLIQWQYPCISYNVPLMMSKFAINPKNITLAPRLYMGKPGVKMYSHLYC